MTQAEAVVKKIGSMELRLKGLTEISRMATISSSIDEILDSIMDMVLKVMQTDAGSLMLVDEAGNLATKIIKGRDAAAVNNSMLRMGEGIAGSVAETGESITIPDIAGKIISIPESNNEIDRNLYNILCVPMKFNNRTIGVVQVINRREKQPFSFEDVDILEAIAAQITVLIENTSLFNLAQKEAKALRTLFEVNEVLNSAKNIQSLLDLTIKLATRFMAAETSALMLLDDKTDELIIKTTEDELPKARIRLGEGIAGMVAKNGEPILIEDTEFDLQFSPEIDNITGYQAKSLLAVPLKTRYKIIGVMEVVNKIDNTRFTHKDKEFFCLFANQVASAIEQAMPYMLEEPSSKPIVALHEKPRLGEVLMSYNLIADNQIQEALNFQSQNGGKIGEILIRLGLVTEDAVNCALSTQLNIPYVWLKSEMVDIEAVKIFPRDMLERYVIIPIMKIGNELTLVMNDPLDTEMIENVRRITNCTINPSLGSKENILSIIRDILGIKGTEAKELDVDSKGFLREVSGETFLARHLEQALEIGAEEIHLEPTESGLWVRYRQLGILEEKGRISLSLHPEIVFKAKMIGGLDILKEGIAQENELVTKIGDRNVGLTVATMPTAFGESIFIQVFPIDVQIPSIDTIGFEAHIASRLKETMQRPTGVVIVTGPGRSGKTTTIYSLLKEVNANKRKVATIETRISPYQEPKFVQLKTKDILSTLKVSLKQEPDVVMLGEADESTIAFALRSCLQGKLIVLQQEFPTCFDVLYHLFEVAGGIVVASSLLCIIAQRMPRALCWKCKGEGCEECNYSGHDGYSPIFEVFFVNEEWRELIRQGDIDRVKNLAKKSGFVDLRSEALRKIENGQSTIEEMLTKGVII
ncbi:Flp pilus assembly complex ATPase component TadA [bacterium]|nr:Flp pilus assembly complex ATPase component TadA [bacterium]MBU1753956.1 Flp pilus assembly complex ATPase component TadA [bacterium]